MQMDVTDATRLNLIDQAVYEKTGQPLNNLQRLILNECWQPSKKTYEEIATQNNYSGSYIQQRVAQALWHLMSEIVGAKVTKSNCRSVLLRYLDQLPETPTPPLAKIDDFPAKNRSETTLPPQPYPLEFPTESVPIGSPYYINREPYESSCYQLIIQPGALIRLKAPRQMGKTSLMNRIIAHAQDYPAVILNFQQTEQTVLSDLDRLLRWLCANITRQLKLAPALDEYWDDDVGSKMSCTLYLEEYILENVDAPIILALEESSELFEYLDVSKDFFSMLRTWHEYTKHQEAWQKLRLILVQSTETYLPLNINQSPFNVGFEAALTRFTREQVNTLAARNGISLNEANMDQLMSLLAGHPYLVRLTLYHLAKGSIDIETLFITASTDEGIFNNHLHRHLWNLQQYAELGVSFRKCLNQPGPVGIPQTQAFKLHSMGLVTLDKNQVNVSCDLYRQYFSEHL